MFGEKSELTESIRYYFAHSQKASQTLIGITSYEIISDR
jgi:hypothetical protein